MKLLFTIMLFSLFASCGPGKHDPVRRIYNSNMDREQDRLNTWISSIQSATSFSQLNQLFITLVQPKVQVFQSIFLTVLDAEEQKYGNDIKMLQLLELIRLRFYQIDGVR